jgi:hypothetical protein
VFCFVSKDKCPIYTKIFGVFSGAGLANNLGIWPPNQLP